LTRYATAGSRRSSAGCFEGIQPLPSPHCSQARLQLLHFGWLRRVSGEVVRLGRVALVVVKLDALYVVVPLRVPQVLRADAVAQEVTGIDLHVGCLLILVLGVLDGRTQAHTLHVWGRQRGAERKLSALSDLCPEKAVTRSRGIVVGGHATRLIRVQVLAVYAKIEDLDA